MDTGKVVSVDIESGCTESHDSDLKITLLWYDITNYSRTAQFFCCCIGIFVFYLLYGYLLELIFTIEGSKQNGWYLTLIQFFYYATFGWIEKCFYGFPQRKIPLRIYFVLASLTLGTIGFSNTSLQYLNYPTQVIFKSCKLIPVLVGGILIQKKKYGSLDFIAAICMCIGLAWFTLADSYTSPNFNFTGVIIISAALMCDAAIGNLQEKVMRKYKASNIEVVYFSYALGFIYLLIILVFSGKFFSGFSFCLNNPIQTYGYGLLFSASGYLGIQIILTLVKTFGALVAATVTTCRKAISIVISFILFSKPFTTAYLWSGLIIVLGIYFNILSKDRKSMSLTKIWLGNKYLLNTLKNTCYVKKFLGWKSTRKEFYTTV